MGFFLFKPHASVAPPRSHTKTLRSCRIGPLSVAADGSQRLWLSYFRRIYFVSESVSSVSISQPEQDFDLILPKNWIDKNWVFKWYDEGFGRETSWDPSTTTLLLRHRLLASGLACLWTPSCNSRVLGSIIYPICNRNLFWVTARSRKRAEVRRPNWGVGSDGAGNLVLPRHLQRDCPISFEPCALGGGAICKNGQVVWGHPPERQLVAW